MNREMLSNMKTPPTLVTRLLCVLALLGANIASGVDNPPHIAAFSKPAAGLLKAAICGGLSTPDAMLAPSRANTHNRRVTRVGGVFMFDNISRFISSNLHRARRNAALTRLRSYSRSGF